MATTETAREFYMAVFDALTNGLGTVAYDEEVGGYYSTSSGCNEYEVATVELDQYLPNGELTDYDADKWADMCVAAYGIDVPTADA
jgi:hypothetical protein